MKQRVRIVSDGTPRGTKVYVDDELLPNVIGVQWAATVGDSAATVQVDLVDVPVDLVGERAVD